MEWIIKQNATLPIFQFEIAKDGRGDFRRSQTIQNTSFYISVYDEVTKKIRVASRPCYITTSASTSNPDEIIYYVNYQFTNKETKVPGNYVAQISAINSEGTIVLPMNDKINVSVLESFSLDYQNYSSNYIIERPCCVATNTSSVESEIYILTETGVFLISENGEYIIEETLLF